MHRDEAVEHQMTSEIGKQVFTTNGVYIGSVQDITLDVDGEKATKLAVSDVNTELFEGVPENSGLLIPYRWVRATDDIVLVADIVGRVELPDKHQSASNFRTVTDATESEDSEEESQQRAD